MSTLEIELTSGMEQHLRETKRRGGIEAKAYVQSLLLKDLEKHKDDQPKHSIMELHGIGRGAWAGVNVQQYTNEMRDEWDHRL
jgi:hypothetical protein